MQNISDELQTRLQLFGIKLANQRKKKGLTQQELATHLNISQRVQSGYERGDVAPKLDYLFKLSEVGFDIPTLLFAGENQGIYALDPQEQTVVNLYRQADTEVKLHVLESLAGNIANKKEQGDINQNIAVIAGQQTITKN